MTKSEAATISAGTSTSITNVFVLMLENHSFDHIFAMSGIPGIRAATVADSNTYGGNTYFVKAGAPASMTTDPGHEFDDVVEQLHANNSGFASNYVSPLIPKGTVDHTLYDHASIPATLERMLGMEPLTERDGCANDLRALLTNPKPREDCPRTLHSPVPPVQILTQETMTEIDQPLPQSGNWIGFLQILLKTELEMSRTDEKAQAEILRNYQKITTTSAAKAYIQSIGAKIEAKRKKSE